MTVTEENGSNYPDQPLSLRRSLRSTKNMLGAWIAKCYVEKSIRVKSQRKFAKYIPLDKSLHYKLKAKCQKNALEKRNRFGYRVPMYIYEMDNSDIHQNELYKYPIDADKISFHRY